MEKPHTQHNHQKLSELDQAPDPNSPDYFTIEDFELPEFEVRQANFRDFQAKQMEKLREEDVLGKAYLGATTSSQEHPLPDDARYRAGIYRNLIDNVYGVRFVSISEDGSDPITVDVPVYQLQEGGEREPFDQFGSVSAETVADAVTELEHRKISGEFPDLRLDLFDLEEPAISQPS